MSDETRIQCEYCGGHDRVAGKHQCLSCGAPVSVTQVRIEATCVSDRKPRFVWGRA